MADTPRPGTDSPSGGPNPSRTGRGRKSEPWVVAQARREVEAAESAVKNATSDITKKSAQEDLKRAKERLQGLLKAQQRNNLASQRVQDAQAAVDAAAQTPGKADDRRAQERLDRETQRAENAQGKRDEARSDARDYFYSQMGPMIAQAIKEFPELREFFRRAIAEGWNAAKQERELNNPDNAWYDFWQAKGTYWRQGFQTQYGPSVTQGVWDERKKKAKEAISAAAAEAGLVLAPNRLEQLATQYWYSEWQADPDALLSWAQSEASKQRRPVDPTEPDSGVDPLMPASRNTKIRELADLAEAYGLDLDAKALGDWADLILDPKKNTNGIQDTRFKEFLVQESRSKYVTFGDQLDGDTNLRQLAGAYVSELSRLLELDPASIRFAPGKMDPLLQKALTNVDRETGKPSRIPLWEFTKQIRQDERWQYTDNARDSYMSAGTKFAKALGLAG